MNTQTDKPIGNFYEVSKGAIKQVAEQGKRAALVLAYLALKRSQQVDHLELVNAGRTSIGKTLGVSRYKAEQLMNDLRAISWGGSLAETALVDAKAWNDADAGRRAHHGYAGKNGRGTSKVMPNYGDEFIYLPNTLNTTHRGFKHSPLGQLFKIRDKQLALDATMLLLSLYEYLDLQTYGGVDPTILRHPWRHEGESLGYQGSCDKGFIYWLVDMRTEDGQHWTHHLSSSTWEFIESITGETAETGADRFWTAWNELENSGLVFQVAMVFDADPAVDPDTEALYPLWTFNTAVREEYKRASLLSGGLARETFSKARKENMGDELEALMEDTFDGEGNTEGATGVFMMIADSSEARTVGVVRPRFTPKTNDGLDGEQFLEDQARAWFEKLL